jgi:uncharacterized membrane protein
LHLAREKSSDDSEEISWLTNLLTANIMRIYTNTIIALVVSLAIWCVAWESQVAPLREGGSWMTLKSIPILLPIIGIIHEREKSFQILSLIVIAYLIEAVVRSYADSGTMQAMALGELILSLSLFFTLIARAKKLKKSSLKKQ